MVIPTVSQGSGFVSIGINSAEAIAAVEDLRKRQVPFAASNALNTVALQARDRLRASLPGTFDRPTPFTLGGWYVQRSTKKTLTAFVQDKAFATKGTPAGKYLSHHISGTQRPLKRAERLLAEQAKIIKPGSFLVPIDGAPFDAYGNFQRSHMLKILSWFGGTLDTAQRTPHQVMRGRGKNRKMTRVRPPFVAAKGKSGNTTIYRVDPYNSGHRNRLTPWLQEVPAVRYKVRFSPFLLIEMFVFQRFPVEFEKALDAAVRSGLAMDVAGTGRRG
jgi:hypothetical protein